LFTGEDVDQARHALSRMYNEAVLEPEPGGAPFRMKISGVELPRLGLCSTWCSSAALAYPVDPLDFYTVQVARRGRCTFDIGTGSDGVPCDDRKGALLSAGHSVRVHHGADNSILGLIVKEEVLRDVLSAWTGSAKNPRVVFRTQFDSSQPRVASLLSLIDDFVRELDRSNGILDAPAVVSSFEHTLITSLLFGLEHNLTETLLKPKAEAGSAQVRLIEEYVEAHATEPIDMATIACVTGHSAHSIYRAFRRHRGYTPMEFLHTVRMKLARRRLLEGHPGSHVRSTAMACGFGHAGRFSVEYKRRFGETPRDTLKRATRMQGME